MKQHEEPSTIAGGYIRIPVANFTWAWSQYLTGGLRLYDLRTWMACFEILARRCGVRSRGDVNVKIRELHGLLGGVGGEHVRASLRRLAKAGLVENLEGEFRLVENTLQLPEAESSRFQTLLKKLGTSRRVIPVPRRLLRWLVAEGTKVSIATGIAHVLRCCYLHGVKATTLGACKASWIAEVFQVGRRNVLIAREKLIAEGWLERLPVPQWYKNRYGGRYRMMPEKTKTTELCTTQTTPPSGLFPIKTTLPVSNQNLPTEFQNQKPCSAPAVGVRVEKVPKPEKPNWHRIELGDLRNGTRLVELFRQAVCRQLVSESEADRLRFFTAAEHSLGTATRNPAGLFRHLVENARWHFCTQADEDRARQKLAPPKDTGSSLLQRVGLSLRRMRFDSHPSSVLNSACGSK
jgi:hypothetical protein